MEGDLLLAQRAALAGAAIGLRYFAALTELPQELKSDGSVVTEADRIVEATIRAVLTNARPGDAVLGEETGQTGGGSRRWIVDPIDGTALFVAGDNRWLVLVALEEDGEIVVGVAAVPAQNRIWWAQRGRGGFEADISGVSLANEQQITVDSHRPDTLSEARLGVLPSQDAISPEEWGQIGTLTAVAPPVPWGIHPALLVATGRMDLAVQTQGQVWDYAATSLIVEEAGGCFSGLNGHPRPAAGPALFARSAAVHAAALQVLRATG